MGLINRHVYLKSHFSSLINCKLQVNAEIQCCLQFVLLKQNMLVDALFACLITEVYPAKNLSVALTK